jgi:uncharacterized membrane protein
MLSSVAHWFWVTIVVAVATTITAFMVPEDTRPAVYVRYVLGVVLVLCFPGYAFVRAPFPAHVPFKTSSENLDTIERLALSVGMNLVLVPIVGLLLNYSRWGIRLTPMTLSLLGLTTISALTAIIREHQTRIKDL